MQSFQLLESPTHTPEDSLVAPAGPKGGRRSAVDRMAATHLAAMGDTVADTVGHGTRQRLVWLGLLAMPLLVPIPLPGMASAVGMLCLMVAWGLCSGQPPALPGWLGQRVLNARVKTLLANMVHKVVRIMARLGRPRMLALSNPPARLFNGLMLAIAGLAIMVPIPVITVDNVLPALAIVLITWGLRLRDGLMLMAGHAATIAAVVSVVLLGWGGAVLLTDALAWTAG